MNTENIKVFSLSDDMIILAELVSYSTRYLIMKNPLHLYLEWNEETEEVDYDFLDYYSQDIFPLNTEIKLYYNNIVVEGYPEVEILLQYIATIKLNKKQSSNHKLKSTIH